MIFDHRSYWVPKDLDDRQAYQDAFDTDAARGLASIADGASSSLFAGRWAKLLAEASVREPISHGSDEFSDWLRKRRKDWNEPINEDDLAWHQKAKLRDGAHATWLWLSLFRDESTRADEWRFESEGIGDCCMFLVRDGQSILIFPVTSSDAFTSSPATLASGKGSEARVKDAWQEIEGSCQAGDMFVLCTDALAAWGVKELEHSREPDWHAFWDAPSAAFEERVKEMRRDSLIRYDDTTLLLLKVMAPPPEADQITKIVEGVKSSISDWTSTIADAAERLTGKGPKPD